ncbi:CRISPR-associated endonuclease Cas1 1 [Anaerocolumna cellulosilytica]|uniref:CRISPR-associated endonuclease Cas1 n=1 Tax=Anaerocolumna cellulosilytica TaxID=433286 RepID=A0A6S6R4L5_9FIRM|nr:type I-C CRISPR-associated endonuclease Cas1c [Anaerocolumna cellulosilytica]MBB5194688.1 CRISPR-associated protein Cas1 [Anaerocolumna cellulosilytica]BCJ94350.1 CRISPR-associated endonuclease Cas1 1 [Anaerocolumna cellulosilytica]
MKRLLNTLYISNPESYLSLDGENVVVRRDEKEVGRVPLHNIDGIVSMGFAGTSPRLMGYCAEKNISLTFLSTSGRFLATICGESKGNVILRKEQYRISDNKEQSLRIAKNMILGKVYNSKWVLERTIRDYSLRLNTEILKEKSEYLTASIKSIQQATAMDQLRGMEGEAASVYFSVFDTMILQQKDKFQFDKRNRRPPLDKVNALLSFTYTLLVSMCKSALETVGLDAYVGFMHTDRPGRASLALDLMEELRSVLADRFVLTLINKKMIHASGFYQKENGAVIMEDETRKTVIFAWQSKKQEEIVHPFLKEKIEWGMVPYVQALLLARYVRGDLDAYPPFLWK